MNQAMTISCDLSLLRLRPGFISKAKSSTISVQQRWKKHPIGYDYPSSFKPVSFVGPVAYSRFWGIWSERERA